MFKWFFEVERVKRNVNITIKFEPILLSLIALVGLYEYFKI